MDKRAGIAEGAVRSTFGDRPVRLFVFGEVGFLVMSNHECTARYPIAQNDRSAHTA